MFRVTTHGAMVRRAVLQPPRPPLRRAPDPRTSHSLTGIGNSEEKEEDDDHDVKSSLGTCLCPIYL